MVKKTDCLLVLMLSVIPANALAADRFCDDLRVHLELVHQDANGEDFKVAYSAVPGSIWRNGGNAGAYGRQNARAVIELIDEAGYKRTARIVFEVRAGAFEVMVHNVDIGHKPIVGVAMISSACGFD